MSHPHVIINEWMQAEEQHGAPSGRRAVLASVTKDGVPHSRVVAIREVTQDGIVFFTQKISRKHAEMLANPNVSLTFWFAQTQREVMLDGVAEALSQDENQSYWNTMPRERQLYFSAYAPMSGEVIDSQDVISAKQSQLAEQYQHQDVPMSPHYRGFRIKAKRYVFYTLFDSKVSDILELVHEDGAWRERRLSP